MRVLLFHLLSLSILTASCSTLQAEDNLAGTIQADVVYGHKDGLAMTFDVYHPQRMSNKAAILFMMSGGWVSRWAPPEDTKRLFQPYLDDGFTIIAVRHGSSPRYSIAEAVSDVNQAVQFIREHSDRWSIEPNRLGVMGMSAGGHLSLMLGTTGDDPKDQSSRVAAVVSLVPPTDLKVMAWQNPDSLPVYKNFPALDLSEEEAEQVSPLQLVTEDDAPSLVIMGGKDNLVPAQHGELIAEAFKKVKVPHKLLIYPDAGHGLEGEENRKRTVKETIAWFRKYLLESE